MYLAVKTEVELTLVRAEGWVPYRVTSVTFCLKLFILLNACGMQSEHHWRVADTEALDAGDLLMCFVFAEETSREAATLQESRSPLL